MTCTTCNKPLIGEERVPEGSTLCNLCYEESGNEILEDTTSMEEKLEALEAIIGN